LAIHRRRLVRSGRYLPDRSHVEPNSGVNTAARPQRVESDIPPDLACALVTHSSDGLVVVDADGTLRFASPAAERMLGYRPRATFGRNVFDMVHPDDQVSALEGFESTKSSSYSRPLPTLETSVHLDEAYRLLMAGNTGVLAVADGAVVDIITRIDLIQYYNQMRSKT